MQYLPTPTNGIVISYIVDDISYVVANCLVYGKPYIRDINQIQNILILG